jgi:transcriptional regulator with XRE-family HTH domain
VATPRDSGDKHCGDSRWSGAVTQPVDYMSVGERIAIYRRRRGLSQLALANMIGRSEAWLSQVERGIRHVDRVSVLIRLAQVLKVTVEDLIGQPLSLAPNGGIEFRAIPALRAALTDYEVIPATFGIALGDGPVRNLPSLRRNVDQANRLYQAAHYEEAGLLCSRLIGETQRATRELTGDDRRGAFGVLAETYHITAKTLTKVGETELAWIAAERSLPAAQLAEVPLLMAASAYHLGHVFLRAGQVKQAVGVAMTAARALEPGLATATPEHSSAWGALHLTGLIAVARQDDRVAVRQLLGEARATANRLGQDRNDFWTAFGPTNVALHEVSTAVELGDAGEVVRKGEAVDPSRFPPGLLGRRAQVFIDLTRGYTQQRKDAAAVNVLLEAERIAPEAVRYQVIVKEMLRELLRREHRASTPQLRPLAARVGIIRESA